MGAPRPWGLHTVGAQTIKGRGVGRGGAPGGVGGINWANTVSRPVPPVSWVYECPVPVLPYRRANTSRVIRTSII